jgi:hypothetical protein
VGPRNHEIQARLTKKIDVSGNPVVVAHVLGQYLAPSIGGAPLAMIQGKPGHRGPSITLDYLGLADDDVREWSEGIDR